MDLNIEIESVSSPLIKNLGKKQNKNLKENKITTSETITAVFEGSYGNALGGRNDGSHDQDFSGGVVVHSAPDTDTISMFGNAWKAYKLSESFKPTKSSYIEFDFTVVMEAEGHAICLDEGKKPILSSSILAAFRLQGGCGELWTPYDIFAFFPTGIFSLLQMSTKIHLVEAAGGALC